MKLVETDSSFELHISSAVTDYYVISNNTKYFYKRMVIPSLLVNFFFEVDSELKYLYLYFVEDRVFLSIEEISDIKFSRRKLMKFKDKNSYFINLNNTSLTKHSISVKDRVVFVVSADSVLNSVSSICIELLF